MKKPRQNKVIIGVTGNFGSGKTTVSRMLASSAVKIIDADRITHDIMRPGTVVYRKIIRAFGASISIRGKAVNRQALGRRVFDDARLLAKLNRIVHPEAIRIIRAQIKQARQRRIILDAPLLIEAGLASMVDKLIVVAIDKKEQVARLLRKTQLTRPDIEKRIRAQISSARKIRLADFVIDNSGTINQTRKQVYALRRLLWRS